MKNCELEFVYGELCFPNRGCHLNQWAGEIELEIMSNVKKRSRIGFIGECQRVRGRHVL